MNKVSTSGRYFVKVSAEPAWTNQRFFVYWRNIVTIERTVKFLNEILKQDIESISKIFLQTSVPAEEWMINHPTIMVTQNDEPRLLGVINGFISDGHSIIFMNINPKTKQIINFDVGTIDQDGHVRTNG
jgi:hypothetical protein